MLSSRGANDERLTWYDVKHYDLSISFDILNRTFTGNVKVRAQILKPLTEFVLSASDQTLTIDSVLFDGLPLSYEHTNDHLVAILPLAAEVQTMIEVVVFYHGISQFHGQYESGGVSFNMVKGLGRIATSSEPTFARTWWPCKDVPDDKATATLNVTVPTGLTAVSNGILTGSQRYGNTTTFTWETRYPTPTYLIAISAAKYRQISDPYTGINGQKMKISYWVFPEDVDKAKNDFANTRQMMNFLAKTFCEYPFVDEKFGYVEVMGNITMENQTICSIEQRLITGNQQFELTYFHELAHHWWGDLISPLNWQHTWLNEGFSTYAEALYLESTRGPEWYHRYMDNLMSVRQGQYAGSVFGRTDTVFWDSFAPRVYHKGAIILYMLRGLVGDTAFFTIMRNHVNNPELRYGNARTEDFIRECETVYGHDLGWFFKQWVFAYTDSIDRPEIEYSWSDAPGSPTYTLTLNLEQKTASRLLYKLPIAVQLTARNSTHTYMIVDSLATQTFTFPVPEKTERVEIDRDNRIFKILHRKDRF